MEVRRRRRVRRERGRRWWWRREMMMMMKMVGEKWSRLLAAKVEVLLVRG